jgi:hypothetical protein
MGTQASETPERPSVPTTSGWAIPDEAAALLASALVRAGRSGRDRRIALSNWPAPGSMISSLDRRAFLAIALAAGGPGDRVMDRRAFIGALASSLLAAQRACEASQTSYLEAPA